MIRVFFLKIPAPDSAWIHPGAAVSQNGARHEEEEMSGPRLRDRLWLWGMKVNVLQETADYRPLGFADSTLDAEQAIQRTGIANVLLAGHLPLDRATLDAIPSARRLIAKNSLHRDAPPHLALDECVAELRRAKQLAATDPRIDAYLIDDFSTGSIAAGARPEHLARLQFVNAAGAPHLPLMGTVYEMSLEDERVWACLPYFAGFLSPLWHSAAIDQYPGYLARIAELSGDKPQLACIYLFDFGNRQLLSYDQMQRQLDVAESLLREERVFGVCILGTCMMDLEWEANRCFYDWLDRAGDDVL